MSKSKPMRAFYAYSLLDEMTASPTQTIPADKLNAYLAVVNKALHALETAENPTVYDWKVAYDIVQMVHTLVHDLKVCEDDGALIADAATGLDQAYDRYMQGKKLRLDGKGLHSVRSVVEDYVSIATQVPHRTMVRCHRLTEQRIYKKFNLRSKYAASHN